MMKFRWILASVMLITAISLGSALPQSEAFAQPPEESTGDEGSPSDRRMRPTQKSAVGKARRARKCSLKKVRHAVRRLASRRGK